MAVILAVLLLAVLAACKNKSSPETPPPTETTAAPAAPSASSASPGNPSPVESQESPGESAAESPEETSAAAHETSSPAPETGSGPADTVRITVELDSATVIKGTILDPIVTISPDDAEDKTYTLHSGDENVLRQVYGFWTAVGGGSTELIATAANGSTSAVTVTVLVPLEAVSLSASDITLIRGESVTLSPIYTPADTTDTQIEYSSDDEEIASVSEDGMILAVGAGTTVIRCAAGEFTADCTVTVVVPVTDIILSTDRRIYKVGDSGSLTVQIRPQDATDKSFTAEMSSPAITLTGTYSFSCDGSGEVTITVTAANGMTASQTVTVIDLVAYANEVFRLTNAERTNAGLEPFSMMSSLTRTAGVRAREIIELFSHDRPDGSDCFTAFDENDVPYTAAGENIAMGQRTPADVVRAWMNSAGHRENIMNGDFSHLGVGVAMDSSGRLYWSQNFTD